LRPISGADAVSRFLLGISRGAQTLGLRTIVANGSLALSARVRSHRPGVAEHSFIRVDLGDDGRVAAIHIVVTPKKLRYVSPPELGEFALPR
jgi:hypothetical protein